MSATVQFPVHAAAPAQDMPRPRFGLLLVALLATLVVQGAAPVGDLQRVIVSALFCAFVWAVLNRVDGPFFAGGQAGNASDFQYFSFVTLTTVGYGDLTARSALGHTLAVLEALVGQIYLVTVVSLFVTNVGRARARGG